MSIAHLIATPNSFHNVHIVTLSLSVILFVRVVRFFPLAAIHEVILLFTFLLLLLLMATRYLNNMSFVTLDSRTVN